MTSQPDPRRFATQRAFEIWLRKNHASSDGAWLLLAKPGADKPTRRFAQEWTSLPQMLVPDYEVIPVTFLPGRARLFASPHDPSWGRAQHRAMSTLASCAWGEPPAP
jgi:hypothetical protein